MTRINPTIVPAQHQAGRCESPCSPRSRAPRRRFGDRRRRQPNRRSHRSRSRSSPASTPRPSCAAPSPTSVTATITINREGMDDVVLDLADLSNVAVARFTIQPGAQFPWHTHPGPVLVTVTQGELVYVMAEGLPRGRVPRRHRVRRPRPRHGAHGLQPDRRRDRDRRHVHRGTRRRSAVDHRRHHRTGRQLRPSDQPARLTAT